MENQQVRGILKGENGQGGVRSEWFCEDQPSGKVITKLEEGLFINSDSLPIL